MILNKKSSEESTKTIKSDPKVQTNSWYYLIFIYYLIRATKNKYIVMLKIWSN